jgi:hypothetical protein
LAQIFFTDARTFIALLQLSVVSGQLSVHLANPCRARDTNELITEY